MLLVVQPSFAHVDSPALSAKPGTVTRAVSSGGAAPLVRAPLAGSAFALRSFFAPRRPIRRLMSIVTGSIAVGGSPYTLTIATSGDTGQITFSGTAGEHLGLAITGVSFGTSSCCSSFASVQGPSGTLKSLTAFGTSGLDVALPTLPSTGTYTIVIDPQGNTGSATLTLSDDIAGSVSVGGSSTTVTTTRAGQNARISFTGTAGEHLGFALTNVTIGTSGCCSAIASVVRASDESLVQSLIAFGTSGAQVNVKPLPADGTYWIVLDPGTLNTGDTGSATVTLSDDVATTVSVGGSA